MTPASRPKSFANTGFTVNTLRLWKAKYAGFLEMKRQRGRLGQQMLRLSAANALIRYQRIEELPRIDWKSRARDGGYTWDFRHACPPSDDPAYHALVPELVDDTLAWQSLDTGPEPSIQIQEDSSGELWWRVGKADRLRPRRFCRPDDLTLIVEQPGPRGVSLPHRYDIFAHGGLIYFNGLQVYYRERASLDAQQ